MRDNTGVISGIFGTMNRQKRQTKRSGRAANVDRLRGTEEQIGVAFRCKSGREIARVASTPVEHDRLLRRRDARIVRVPALPDT